MGQERLNALAAISIHKDSIAGITDYNKRVVDLFAALKSRRAEFLYK